MNSIQQFIQRFFIVPFILLMVSLLFLSCEKSLSRENSETYLRAFDNELITVARNISKTEAINALKTLVKINNLPLPFQNLAQSDKTTPALFSFNEMKGYYCFNKEQNTMVWLSKSDSIIVEFPFLSKKDSLARLIVVNYKEENSMWGTMIPTLVDIKLEIAKRNIFELVSNGKVNYNIPTKINTSIKLENYYLTCDFNSRLTKRTGKFYVDVEVLQNDKPKMVFTTKFTNNISDPDNALLEKFEMKAQVFPVELFVALDYKNVNENTTDFIDEFNSNSTIIISSQKNERIGKVELKDRFRDERLNYAIVFSDNTFEYLDELLLSYKYIMNAKYDDVSLFD